MSDITLENHLDPQENSKESYPKKTESIIKDSRKSIDIQITSSNRDSLLISKDK